MAEKISTTPRYLNQFKNRTVVESTPIFIPSPDLTALTQAINQITGSITSVTQSLGQISQSLTTQSVQIENLSSTANSFNPNKIFVNKETPSGLIDGVNTVYVLENTPTVGSEHLYLNGLLIDGRASTDYTITGSIVTFNEPLLPGMKLNCTYYYVDNTPVKIFKDKEVLSGPINGVNKLFTLQHSPVEDSEHLYLNGLLQENGISGDYEISGSTITFKEAPPTNTNLRGTYYHML
jgi:hypothetical protein